jgi:hypothetical protein
MNLEHLCKIVNDNWLQLNKKHAIKVVKQQFELLAWKKNKLKLGAIAFEIKEHKLAELVLWEDVEIKYIRQDTTIDDEQKLENILKRLGWQWDAKNIIALNVVIIGFFSYFIANVRLLYYKHFPTLVIREGHFDYLIKYSFESTFSPFFNSDSNFIKTNFWIVDSLTDFCILFDIIF